MAQLDSAELKSTSRRAGADCLDGQHIFEPDVLMSSQPKPQKVPDSLEQTAAPQIIGWQEWASLPDLGFERLRVKIDTGARTSSLHAWRIEPAGLGQDETGEPVAFLKLSLDGNSASGQRRREIVTPLIRYATVSDSGGRRERRPVIRTRLVVGSLIKDIEVNVTNREAMRFRMIIGRTALENDFIVDVNREFLLGPPKRQNG